MHVQSISGSLIPLRKVGNMLKNYPEVLMRVPFWLEQCRLFRFRISVFCLNSQIGKTTITSLVKNANFDQCQRKSKRMSKDNSPTPNSTQIRDYEELKSM